MAHFKRGPLREAEALNMLAKYHATMAAPAPAWKEPANREGAG
ncbi:MAG: hypothetical protein ACREYD_04910 [Casimicrobiaceae bacterium]